MRNLSLAVLAASMLAAGSAAADPVHYTIDPNHTFPSFSLPHIQGISTWRGKITNTTGSVVLDRQARTGSVDITMQANSFDFGLAKLDEHVESDQIMDARKFPTLSYKADSIKFDGDTPSQIDGQLTMHGVTRPVTLKIDEFKCIMHPMLKREVCGVEASASFDRSAYGMDFGKAYGFSMETKLHIQAEGVKQ